jgi:TonB family protein
MRQLRRGLAMTSLALGCLGLPTAGLLVVGGLLGLTLGVVALVKAFRDPTTYSGKDLAWAGIVTNTFSLVAAVPLFALLVFLPDSPWSRIKALIDPLPLPEPYLAPAFDLPPLAPPPPPMRKSVTNDQKQDPVSIVNSAERGLAERTNVVRMQGQIQSPQQIRRVDPVYPPAAKKAGVEGAVILEATISPQGHVINVKVLKSIPLLDQAAINAVSQWIYAPTLLDGVPVPVLVTVTINFRMN